LTFISYSQSGENLNEKKENMTYQLIEAFVEQERFKIIDLENLPVIIDEKNLCQTGICRNDGLKEGMKLLLYNRNINKDEDYFLLGEAKVERVKEEYSLAKPLQYLIETNIDE